jgi:DNA polymerase III epsilon subunit-like protein
MRLIFTDTETGGLDPTSTDLLTVALIATEGNVVLGTLELAVQASRVTPEAMAVNKIDLDQHNAKAMPKGLAIAKITDFLCLFPGDRNKAVLAGHNVSFDRGFLVELFRQEGADFQTVVSHHMIDTVALAILMADAGHPKPDSFSLGPCLKAWGLTFEGEAHTAMADARASFGLYNTMAGCVRAILRTQDQPNP